MSELWMFPINHNSEAIGHWNDVSSLIAAPGRQVVDVHNGFIFIITNYEQCTRKLQLSNKIERSLWSLCYLDVTQPNSRLSWKLNHLKIYLVTGGRILFTYAELQLQMITNKIYKYNEYVRCKQRMWCWWFIYRRPWFSVVIVARACTRLRNVCLD